MDKAERREVFEEAKAEAKRIFKEARAEALRVYEETIAEIKRVYVEAKAKALEAYKEDTDERDDDEEEKTDELLMTNINTEPSAEPTQGEAIKSVPAKASKGRQPKAIVREKHKAYRARKSKEEIGFLAPGILRVLFELMDKGEELSVRNITDKTNENYDEADRLGYRKVGWILTALGISKRRQPYTRAYAVHELKSKQVLESLRRQYHL